MTRRSVYESNRQIYIREAWTTSGLVGQGRIRVSTSVHRTALQHDKHSIDSGIRDKPTFRICCLRFTRRMERLPHSVA